MSGLEKRKASSRNGDLAMQAKDGHELDSDDMFRLRRRQSNGDEVSELKIRYTGRAVENHSIELRTFAPSLLGVADAVDRYKALCCPDSDLQIRVTSTEPGSFIVTLHLLVGAAVSIGTGMGWDNVANISNVADGILTILKIFKRRFQESGAVSPLPHEVVKETDTDVELKIGKAKLRVKRHTYEASCDGKLAHALGDAAKPATEHGYGDVVFSHGKHPDDMVDINAEVSSAMSKAVMEQAELPPEVGERLLKIDTIQMNSQKWRLTGDDGTNWWFIADTVFLNEFHDGNYVYHPGDMLQAQTEVRKCLQDGDTKVVSRRVLVVKRIISSKGSVHPIQPQFDLDI